jgi:adenosyl cobinamide kinase/adenosyl cobinamide phosphate guanylyltransferase
MMDAPAESDFEAQVANLVRVLAGMRCPVILVANEVGQGIVPENAMARRFRDGAGMINQKMAAGADQVVWMVAGIPVPIK